MREIPLSRGHVALVDDADFDLVVAGGPWHAHPGYRTVYGQRNVPGRRGRTQSLHAFLTGWPFVDHVNGDGRDNQRHNLRPSNYALNAANRPTRSDSRSGFKGVFPNPSGRPWRAQISVNGSKRHLGVFATAAEAARAYDQAALDAWGEHARLNYPKELSLAHP